MRRVMLGLPFLSFFLTMNFPVMIHLYFASTALLTLVQMALFKLPLVKRMFNIHLPNDGLVTNVGKSHREMYNNRKLTLKQSLNDLELLKKSLQEASSDSTTTTPVVAEIVSSQSPSSQKSKSNTKKRK